MPSEPRLLALRDDLVTTLKGMSVDRGYWYDYAGVQIGTVADWDAEKDYDRPLLHMIWDGEVEGDAKHGGEAAEGGAPNRYRHWDQFVVTVSVKDSDPEKVAWRIWADIHKAAIGQSNRHRSSTRVNTFDTGRDWIAIPEADDPVGGMLSVTIVIRWDHLSGDTTSQ
jgi:hypothetical protein